MVIVPAAVWIGCARDDGGQGLLATLADPLGGSCGSEIETNIGVRPHSSAADERPDPLPFRGVRMETFAVGPIVSVTGGKQPQFY